MGFHDSKFPEDPSLSTSPQCPPWERELCAESEAAPYIINDRTVWGSFLEYEQMPLNEPGDRRTKTLTKFFERPSSIGLFLGGEILGASAFPSTDYLIS